MWSVPGATGSGARDSPWNGTSPARLKEVGAIAPRIKDYDSWHTAWLDLARRAEACGVGGVVFLGALQLLDFLGQILSPDFSRSI